MDEVFVKKNISEIEKQRAIKKFDIHQFYDLSDAFSEGADGFLKFRNSETMA